MKDDITIIANFNDKALLERQRKDQEAAISGSSSEKIIESVDGENTEGNHAAEEVGENVENVDGRSIEPDHAAKEHHDGGRTPRHHSLECVGEHAENVKGGNTKENDAAEEVREDARGTSMTKFEVAYRNRADWEAWKERGE